MCGGNGGLWRLTTASPGLSPLVRGKRCRYDIPATGWGSIPACAGETWSALSLSSQFWVYPRLCGGNSSCSHRSLICLGLSPLVRGKHSEHEGGHPYDGSIPACAGETSRHPKSSSPLGVYPRLCGGNKVSPPSLPKNGGLSPLVRGKLQAVFRDFKLDGSIPACAGETILYSSCISSRRVYPRLCGGNSCIQHYDLLKKNGFSILIC